MTDYKCNTIDQLVSTSSPSGIATYTYDGRGNLDQVTVGSQTTDYTYDAAGLGWLLAHPSAF